MTIYVSTLIKAAMRLAQVLEKGEDPPDDEMNDALESLIIMLHSWSARRLMVRATVSETFNLAAGTYSYTIGVGKTFNTSKPIKVTNAFIRDSSNIDTGIDVITKEMYDSYQDKVISTARPVALYYDPGLAQQSTQTGTIYMYYIPDQVYALHIDSQKKLTEISSISEISTFEEPYEKAIKYALALELWPEYHKGDPPSLLVGSYRSAMHTVEVMNSVQQVMGIDLPGTKGTTYNIYTGGYND